jgi:RNA polymerase sigma-70 factor (ECF subfamily)
VAPNVDNNKVDPERPAPRARIGFAFDTVLAAAQVGAPWALERLYRVMAPPVVGYLSVQGAADPEDLANEVFLGVLTRVASFSGDEEQVRSWVFTVAHSRLVDERRRTARRPQPADRDHDAHLSMAGGDAEEDAIQRLSDQRVRALCDQLVPDQRDVLLLRLMAGLTIEVIAENLGKSVGAVKALQRRGLANLRKVLQRDPVPL